jgi:ketosteroid isomerase-like protein
MTRRWLVSGALLTLLAGARASAGEAEQAVLAAQDKRVAATLAADVAALDGMMTADLTYTHSSSVSDSKAEFLDALRTGKYRYKSTRFDERRVRLYGDAAVVSGVCRIEVTSSGRELDIRLRFTELYVKQAGAWKMALWQSTRIPDPAP